MADAKGIVLDRSGGGTSILKALDEVNLAPGFGYSEAEVGTNGIGTALEVGGPILVNGPEHYMGPLRGFSCAGTPITHPVSGALLGLIDITTETGNSNALLLSFSRLAARRIQERILEETNKLDIALLGEYNATSQHTGGSVIALGNEVFMMNRMAQQVFDANDQAALIDQTRDARGRTTAFTMLAELPSGMTARLVYTPAFVNDMLAGGIVKIKEQRSPTQRTVGSRVPIFPGMAGSSALWRQVSQEVLDTCSRAEWLVVEGEPGTGKNSVLRAAHAYTSPGRHLVVLDALDALDARQQSGFLDRVAACLEDSDLIIAHAHVLDGELLQGLTDLLQEMQNNAGASGPWIALTVEAGKSDEELSLGLLRCFPRTVAVPPLRHRLDDVSALVRCLLNQAGRSDLALSGAAMNQLLRLPWPGNVAQLRSVLASVCRRVRSGVVEVKDLPPECHATCRRQLSQMESLARDAIVDALATHQGDKAAASAALGVSRATIYRKIREYGIVN